MIAVHSKSDWRKKDGAKVVIHFSNIFCKCTCVIQSDLIIFLASSFDLDSPECTPSASFQDIPMEKSFPHLGWKLDFDSSFIYDSCKSVFLQIITYSALFGRSKENVWEKG